MLRPTLEYGFDSRPGKESTACCVKFPVRCLMLVVKCSVCATSGRRRWFCLQKEFLQKQGQVYEAIYPPITRLATIPNVLAVYCRSGIVMLPHSQADTHSSSFSPRSSLAGKKKGLMRDNYFTLTVSAAKSWFDNFLSSFNFFVPSQMPTRVAFMKQIEENSA